MRDQFCSSDSLVILKEDKILTEQEIMSYLYLHNGFWRPLLDDDFIFDGSEFRVLKSFDSKLSYAYASLHNDDFVTSVLKELVSELQGVELPNVRYTIEPTLKNWMREYNFTLKEFLINEKYVVCCDRFNGVTFEKLNELGLVNWDVIEKQSNYVISEDEDSINAE